MCDSDGEKERLPSSTSKANKNGWNNGKKQQSANENIQMIMHIGLKIRYGSNLAPNWLRKFRITVIGNGNKSVAWWNTEKKIFVVAIF